MNANRVLVLTAALLAAAAPPSPCPAATPQTAPNAPAITRRVPPPRTSAASSAVGAAVLEQRALAAAAEWLKIWNYNLTPDGVRNLKNLRLLGGTAARAQALTTENMVHLRCMKNLERLELAHMATDAWVANIAGLKKLQVFACGPATHLTDASMSIFAGLPELRTLTIHASGITDAGIARLAGLQHLEVLGLTRTAVTDASLTTIGRLPLRLLFLSFTRISDAGLPSLYGLGGLERLDIQGQMCTPGAVALLKTRLPPTCRVVHP
jgi:hypothetical protein